MADGILTNYISFESSWLCLFNGVISFFWFSHLKNCQVSPTEKIYIEPIYSQFTCLSDNLFRSEQFFMEQARDTQKILLSNTFIPFLLEGKKQISILFHLFHTADCLDTSTHKVVSRNVGAEVEEDPALVQLQSTPGPTHIHCRNFGQCSRHI